MQSAGPLKDVAYDGSIHFRIPTHWVERAEDDGAGLFYGDGGDSGLLRLKLMTFTSQQRLDPAVAYAQLEAMEREPGQILERLPSGNALRAHREQSDADGESTLLHIWMIASVEVPFHLRLAVFSFTHLTERSDDLGTRRTLATLDREIRAARFQHQASKA